MRQQTTVHVYHHPTDRQRGILQVGSLTLPCALGRSGRVTQKREGDGGTPRTVLRPVAVYFRPDQRLTRCFALPSKAISPQDGWCDDVTSHRYNRLIRRPSRFSHEVLWRQDRLYDIVVETNWNRRPAIRGRGSAIFIHLARDGFKPTEGCIALDRKGMKLLLPHLHAKTHLILH